MTAQLVVGVDPGLTTGLAALTFLEGELVDSQIAVQVHGSEGVVPFVQALMGRYDNVWTLLSVEAFVIGGRSGRSSTPAGGRVARRLIGALSECGADAFTSYPAATVKPWATDIRLQAAGILAATKGMSHARDASRHALYAAVHRGVAHDPLSSRRAAR